MTTYAELVTQIRDYCETDDEFVNDKIDEILESA